LPAVIQENNANSAFKRREASVLLDEKKKSKENKFGESPHFPLRANPCREERQDSHLYLFT